MEEEEVFGSSCRDTPMPIPAFDEYGNLPPGIHSCTIDELVEHFGSGSPEREVESKELVQFVRWARRAGVIRVIVDGSFVTSKLSPNDVDIVILPGPGYPRGQPRTGSEERLWPFLHVFVADDEADLGLWIVQYFGVDRRQRVKGVMEVVL